MPALLRVPDAVADARSRLRARRVVLAVYDRTDASNPVFLGGQEPRETDTVAGDACHVDVAGGLGEGH